MPKRQKTPFAPKDEQVRTAARLGRRVAAEGSAFGYRLLSLEKYGNTSHDFLAVHNDPATRRVFAVLLLPNGWVSVRPFTKWGQSDPVLTIIKEEQEKGALIRVWRSRMLPRHWRNAGELSHLSDEDAEEALRAA